ncbi:hypothetical protein K7X08_022612 [Anisodus acutangulus]|uniref:Fungal lipase-type domain-containing protein n=1 Tax=Anisodus acutangulus TaxID=402998 RepID=A0A9Q1MI04_9SOLA|nr:hypothetical protein K7X08_022612 [Anisodus acutangulus]
MDANSEAAEERKNREDVMADVNIFQGALFHVDAVEDIHGLEPMESGQGFMARAKGIPALDLYRLAQKKKRKLVLCGHSLGGAVPVLATLEILRVFAASSKDSEKVQHYFKTYCIPEDLVPRILSPAYFHHYNARSLSISSDGEASVSMSKSSALSLKKKKTEKAKDNEGEQLVLGVVNDLAITPQSLEIQEGSDGISLRPLPKDEEMLGECKLGKSIEESNTNDADKKGWPRMPYLPLYALFGQVGTPSFFSFGALFDTDYYVHELCFFCSFLVYTPDT